MRATRPAFCCDGSSRLAAWSCRNRRGEDEGQLAIAKSCLPAEGFEEVLLPGELEYRKERERQEKGIPFEDGKWMEMLDQLEECEVNVAPWRAIKSIS